MIESGYHKGTGGFTFGDGHTENRKWQNRRTFYRVTYIQLFPHGVPQPNNPDITCVQERTKAELHGASRRYVGPPFLD